VVIGNPPYVNVKNGINANDKSYYLKTYKSAVGQFDLFSLFIEKGLSLGKTLVFIVPKPLINNENYEIIRKIIFNSGLKNVIIGSGIIETAGVESCIFMTSTCCEKKFLVSDFVDRKVLFKHKADLEFSLNSPFSMFCTEVSDEKLSLFQVLLDLLWK